MTRRLLGISFVIALAGCGDDRLPADGADPLAFAESPDTTVSASVPRPEPCAVLTGVEVQAATGIASEGRPSSNAGTNVCTWIDPAGKSAVAQIYDQPGKFEESRGSFASLYGVAAEDVPGLGDRAFHVAGTTGTMRTSTVGVLRGTTAISTQVLGTEGDPALLRSQAEALARTLLEKL